MFNRSLSVIQSWATWIINITSCRGYTNEPFLNKKKHFNSPMCFIFRQQNQVEYQITNFQEISRKLPIK